MSAASVPRYKHALYGRWISMLNRCYNPKNRQYKNYGARGIAVCQRWRGSLDAFAADVGLPPTASHSLDRIDNDGNYEPDNVRWATKIEQWVNSRSPLPPRVFVTIRGETLWLNEWAKRSGIHHATLANRLRRGWNPEKAISTRPRAYARTPAAPQQARA